MNCNVFSTYATADLCEKMLPDSGHIQEEDIKFVNKINTRKNLPLVEPLYKSEDAINSLRLFTPLDYNKRFVINKDFSFEFMEAGHVLGSAVILIEVKGKRILYCADLGREDLPLLRDPSTPSSIDMMILESTYGNRLHDDINETSRRLHKVVHDTINKGGKLIIPSFALERTQELVFFFNELYKDGYIPGIPIYVDSPLACDITSVFRKYVDLFDSVTQKLFREEGDPFGLGYVNYVRDVEESKKINNIRGPVIIISASGMCEAGRILHHLKNNISDSRNTILIVGFMAQNTLGRKIVEGARKVKIFGSEYDVRASVVSLDTLSSHADKNDLTQYVTLVKPKKIYLVHGEAEAQEELKNNLEGKGFSVELTFRGKEVTI